MPYETIFDLARDGGFRGWWLPLFWLLPLAGGLKVARDGNTEIFSIRGVEKEHERGAGMTVALLAGLAFVAISCGFGYDYWRTLTTYREGRATVVEGTIDQLRARPAPEPHDFTVNGETFHRARQSLMGYPGFAELNQPLRLGMQARVTHVDGVIVKLEIVRPPRTPRAAPAHAPPIPATPITGATAAPSRSPAR